MDCISLIKTLHGIPRIIVTLIQISNVLIGVLNIAGSTILLWGLRKTQQTKTISCRFIMIMGAADLITGIIGLIFLTMTLFDPYQDYCWMRLAVQAVLSTSNSLSTLMILFIAFDRYLHMKYLEKYSTKYTKKKGYYQVLISFSPMLLINAAFVFPFSLQTYSILKTAFFSMAIVLPFSILVLYYKAMQAMRRKANQITRSLINHSRALGKAAKRVSVSIIILTLPALASHTIDGVNLQAAIIDQSVLAAYIWISYIIFLANGFCSSVIFISQNIPIRGALRRAIFSIRSEVGIMQTSN